MKRVQLTKTILTITLLLSSTALLAEKHMLIIGGGGEPAGPKTIFDTTTKNLGENLQGSKWKYQMSFNGGHTETEAMMASAFPKPIVPTSSFTAETYKKLLDEYKAKILIGDIKQGDQLVIMVNTHGAQQSPESKTHSITVESGKGVSNFNTLEGAKVVSLDDLQEIVKLTNEKGIKLGIIDLSCHSGNTHTLKKDAPNTCIISSTGPKHYSFEGDNSFSRNFTKNLKKGETLESAFLKARAQSTEPEFPMISTDENEQIIAEVYSSLTPYLYYYDPKNDKLSDYMIENSKDCVVCERETQFKSLIKKIEKLEAITKGSKTGFNGEELKNLLKEYKANQDAIIKQEKALFLSMLNKTETFKATATSTLKSKGKTVTAEFSREFTWSEIVFSDPDTVIASITKDLKSETGALAQANALAAIETWKSVRSKQAQIIFQYPQIQVAQEQSKKIAASIGENKVIANKIAVQEKKFYDELYRQKQSLNVNDPCRRIVF